MQKIISLMAVIALLVCLVPTNTFAFELDDETAVSLRGKVISILGDSISTFAGYIPVEDGFNMEHLSRYPQDNLLTDVNETWWTQVINSLDAKLGINDSWRGATVSGAAPVTTGTTGENACMANPVRIQNLGSNGTPDVILFYGGTNDLAHVSKVGTFDPANAPQTADFAFKKWDNMADGYVQTLLRLKYYYPDALILCLLPTYTTSYYSNTKLEQGNRVLSEICEHYGVPFVDLRDCGITTKDLPDGIHPGEAGMDYITDAVLNLLKEQCSLEPGENLVYSVTHDLSNVTGSLQHYKGITAGKTFEETLVGDNIELTVTMGGKNITDACYSNGMIKIEAVCGDIVVTASSNFSLDDRLQQLPDSYHGVNLWPALEHDAEYYAADGWSVHSSGKVKSVTVPVVAGERIYASSFEAAEKNGSSVNGIRVTFFSETGVLLSMSASEVYRAFNENGWIIAPENARAVCVPMWTDDSNWEFYIWEKENSGAGIHSEYLQTLPAVFCPNVNLWPELKHDQMYYTVNGWDTHASGEVRSVTVPVRPGDQLWATSFGAANTNGSAMNGIRLTWFTGQTVLASVSAGKVYAEFAEYGYLTAPEGAVAVNVVMWNDSLENELYILNRDHSFQNGTCYLCGEADPNVVTVPSLSLNAPTLEFSDMIKVVAFFTAENTEDVEQMGMITYTRHVDVVDVTTAAHVLPGAEYDESTGCYFTSSQGIHAKYLGDTVYLACYAKLNDGTYVYTKLAPYSPITYAINQLKNSSDNELKQLVAAMLNYSAAAQVYFGYNTEKLANADLTDEQKALPEAFCPDMVTAVTVVAPEKQGIFANNKGFRVRMPAISFEGAFSIHYFFTPAYVPKAGITLYYWTEEAFDAADVLTEDNASGTIAMEGKTEDQYRGDLEGIAAKELNRAVYVAAVYSDDTGTWTSGVLGYSIGSYCVSLATKGDAIADLAMSTAVYGYHANRYFSERIFDGTIDLKTATAVSLLWPFFVYS